ncbi:Type IV secretion system protein VirB6 [Gammaproteobacteria bacterium]|nr:Type IV secretion system protein VirB6 [Gammaproteobacteria bacterium]
MFFSTFWSWLQGQLATYVGTNTAAIAGAIEPAAVTLAVLYVMVWGYLCMTGMIAEPIMDGVKRIIVIGLIFGVGLSLWAYNTVIVDTVFNAPSQLTAVIVGGGNAIATIDAIWDRGGYVAAELWNKGGVFNGDVGFYLAGAFVYLVVGAVAVYSMFLLALAQIAISLGLVLGPLFIVMLFFNATKRFFEAWVAMLANYALITILAVLVSALLLQIVESYATQTAALGAAIVTVDALNMVLVSGLSLLLLRQVPSFAAGLASGIALSSFGAVSGLVNWGLGTAKRTTYEFGRGVLDGYGGEPRSRWDSLRRGAGNRFGSGIANMRDRVAGQRTGGTLVPRERVMPKPGKVA